ncbi:hypothetical protein QE152_g36134 [Popillia japonica]|uniref:RanBD1 domain-containing protein n=1 Tax=Popillia japonica TaxID=7064 RepID=A0AAW1IE06_POPJA
MAENTDGVKSQIIMRVDEPTEENKDNEKKEEILSIKPSQICSPTTMGKPVLAPSQFSASNPFSNNTLESKFGQKPLLKSFKLGANSGTQFGKTSFTLNPSRLNPLAKTPVEEDNSGRESDKNKNSNNVANGETLKFVPLLRSESKSSEIIVKPVKSVLPTTQASQNNFVFGQNLQERIIAESNSDGSKSSISCLNSNGTSNMLFSSALKDTKIDNVDVSNKEGKSLTELAKGKSLTELAREYEESRAIKRKYEEVEVKTGEEEEINILHISCKLFAYDKASGWRSFQRAQEDIGYKKHKHTFNYIGKLQIWAEMSIQLAGPKSVRVTAIESSGKIKVFLVMETTEDINKLHKHLDERLKNEIN